MTTTWARRTPTPVDLARSPGRVLLAGSPMRSTPLSPRYYREWTLEVAVGDVQDRAVALIIDGGEGALHYLLGEESDGV